MNTRASKPSTETEINTWLKTRLTLRKKGGRYYWTEMTLSQADFAKFMGISVRTVKSREAKPNEPISFMEACALRFVEQNYGGTVISQDHFEQIANSGTIRLPMI